jgi:hypothetical protein
MNERQAKIDDRAREEQALDALIVLALLEDPGAARVELSEEYAAALGALGDDLIDRLIAGDVDHS